MENDWLHKIAITLFNGAGPATVKKIISLTGSPEAFFAESERALRKTKIPEFCIEKKSRAEALEKAEKECAFIEKKKITPLYYLDSNYPKRLKNCDDSPVILYYKGTANLNAQRTLSVVGTRKATDYGTAFCHKLMQDLRNDDVLIVSGLAFGIDIAAHKQALQAGLDTVGVVAHGLHTLYPKEHRNTAIKMLEQGGLLSDFSSSDPFHPGNFPSRNRIIAGMSDATLVVETDISGGAVITADIANSYNRDVFALPGDVNNPYSFGCNWLVKTNRAAIIQSAQDIKQLLGWQTDKKKKNTQTRLLIDLNEEETKLVNALKNTYSLGIDDICLLCDMPASKTAAILLELEFKGIIRALPGKHYKLV